MVKIKLRLALPTLSALNSWGWKETTKSVAGSLLGQQKVSSRGDAIGPVPGDGVRGERNGKGEMCVSPWPDSQKRERKHGFGASCASV